MKPWEEAWTFAAVSRDGAPMRRELRFDAPFAYDDDASVERMRLAACAPEMARLLLDLEWQGSTDEDACPSCFQLEMVGHSDDCAWLALMRKAALR